MTKGSGGLLRRRTRRRFRWLGGGERSTGRRVRRLDDLTLTPRVERVTVERLEWRLRGCRRRLRITPVVLTSACGRRVDARASHRDLRRASGGYGSGWRRRRAGRTRGGRSAATARVQRR